MIAFIPQRTLATELFELLKKHGLPDTATRFSVHVAMDELVRVDCEFLALDQASTSE